MAETERNCYQLANENWVPQAAVFGKYLRQECTEFNFCHLQFGVEKVHGNLKELTDFFFGRDTFKIIPKHLMRIALPARQNPFDTLASFWPARLGVLGAFSRNPVTYQARKTILLYDPRAVKRFSFNMFPT